jgi:hypothetical protein
MFVSLPDFADFVKMPTDLLDRKRVSQRGQSAIVIFLLYYQQIHFFRQN